MVLGRTELDGGITHLPDPSDGWTRADEVEGVPCRYMNHRAANLAGGAYLYFAVHPSFKSVPIRTGRIEFEYFVRTPVRLKVQYDGMEEGRRRSYKPAGEILNVTEVGSWQTATFHVNEPAFMNSQIGGADFRLDDHWALNLDVRKIWINTDVKVRAGATTLGADVDIDPWVVSTAIAYRF